MMEAARLDQFQKWAYVFGMSPKIHMQLRVGYVCDDKRRSAKTQRAMHDKAGIDRVYDDWSLLMKQRRPGPARATSWRSLISG
jgi:hypothetical protein